MFYWRVWWSLKGPCLCSTGLPPVHGDELFKRHHTSMHNYKQMAIMLQNERVSTQIKHSEKKSKKKEYQYKCHRYEGWGLSTRQAVSHKTGSKIL